MMRLVAIVALILTSLWLMQPSNTTPHTTKEKTSPVPVRANSDKIAPQTISVFTPYWHPSPLNQIQNPINNNNFSDLYYFGVTLTKDGNINTNDEGFANLEKIDTERSFLVIRLIEQGVVDAIISNKQVGAKAAFEVAQLASEQGFKGVLIDLEYSALADVNTKTNITRTISMFVNKSHKNGLLVGATIYGDTFYRDRPYDVKKIGEIVDQIVVMAYDFHKSKSLPGPLFPFDRGIYDYSFKDLIKDFTSVVPSAKLVVAYGMYGYQWETDRQKRPIKKASAVPYRNIVSLKDKCSLPSCVIMIDKISKELTLTTKLTNGLIVVHSETPTSIQTKIDYARRFNTNKTILWASGYW